jgi:hypothetical protein
MDTWNGKSIQSNRGKVQDGWGSMRLQTYAMTKTVKIIKETWLKVWDGLLWAEPLEKLSKVMEEKVGQRKKDGWGSIPRDLRIYAMERIGQVIVGIWLQVWDGFPWADPYP